MLKSLLTFPASDDHFRLILREALVKSVFEGDGLQAVRKRLEFLAALAAEGIRSGLIRVS